MDNNYFNLQGKVALVTGASSGLGWHFAHVLAAAGCVVIGAARRKHKLNELLDSITELGGKAIALPLDIKAQHNIDAALTPCFEQVGVPDILVNNAGIAAASRFLDAADTDTQSVWDTNQSGVWRLSQCVCKRMIEDKKPGSVINIASILGLDVMQGVASYAVSKAAVVQLTKVMALELARYGIRVNAVAPGYVDTDMNHEFLNSSAGEKLIKRVPLRRPGDLDDLSGLLLLLASARSAYMTGAIIPVDGGHLVSGLA